MPLVQSKKELTSLLNNLEKSKNLGLVPTMGALHEGHASLIEQANAANDNVVVTIFVNPTQFNNKEDLDKYPQTLEDDLSLIYNISNEIIVFAPSVDEIYEDNLSTTTYDFEGLDTVMEGAFRDNHFNGVGTIVETLLNLVKPTHAYFGEKDFQQLSIIKKLVALKEIPVRIVGCKIVREQHGLAMSSRNERLSKNIRKKASFIYQTLKTAKIQFGTESAAKVKEWVINEFKNHDEFELEYFEITDIDSLTPTKKKNSNTKYRGFIAVYADNIRLIDNIALN